MPSYLFPGQGSQIKGMGGELFDQYPELTAQADHILGYSVKELCLIDPQQRLNQTQYTQSALYIVTALTYFKKLKDNNKPPYWVAGHSLGEYNALLAAEVFDFATGLQLVKKRGELMSTANNGAMIAVIGLKADVIKAALLEAGLTRVAIANYNSHTQLVLSGLKNDIIQAQLVCEQIGATMVIPLKVSGAFHSPHMYHAQEQFATFLNNFKFSSPKISVIANYTAQPYKATNIHQNLIQQIVNPVLWTETVEYLLTLGELELEEIGPGMVLTGLVRRIKNGQ